MERSIDAEAEIKATTVEKATKSIGEENNWCGVSESDQTNWWCSTAIARSVIYLCPFSVGPQVATVDGAHQENGLGGPAAVVGPPTANAYRYGRKHVAKYRPQNESDDHSNGFAREGNAGQSALESLQRHERYTRTTTDTSEHGERRDDAKRTCRRRSSGNGSTRVSSCRSCSSRYREQRPENSDKGGNTLNRHQGGMERSRRICVLRHGYDRKQHGIPRERCSEKKKEARADGVATIRATPQATQRTELSGRPPPSPPPSVAVHASSGTVTSNEPQPPPPITNTIPLGRILKSRTRRNDAVVYHGRDCR